MIDSIDVMNILEKVIQPNIKMISILVVLIILATKNLETNTIIIFSILIYIFIYYKQIKETFSEIKKEETKIDRIVEDNRRIKKEIHFSEDLNKYLNKLRKYRKYNPQSYDEGYKYIKMFMYTIHDLEKDDISHPKQYFENAQIYLKKSLNLFQSITISVPEENYIHSLKYNKFETTKLGNRIGKLCKKIYKHCYYLLYNLSLRFNEDFFETPDIYKTEINLNADQVEESNTFTEKWELY
tara:strand:- start:344 stop:1063 length:720 start_codon:yes stop_codon:yes gene_type:complete